MALDYGRVHHRPADHWNPDSLPRVRFWSKVQHLGPGPQRGRCNHDSKRGPFPVFPHHNRGDSPIRPTPKGICAQDNGPSHVLPSWHLHWRSPSSCKKCQAQAKPVAAGDLCRPVECLVPIAGLDRRPVVDRRGGSTSS